MNITITAEIADDAKIGRVGISDSEYGYPQLTLTDVENGDLASLTVLVEDGDERVTYLCEIHEYEERERRMPDGTWQRYDEANDDAAPPQ